MGLNVSHGCWEGPYSAFMRFRMALAKEAGIPLELMDWYYPPGIGEGHSYQPVGFDDLPEGEPIIVPDPGALEWLRARNGGPLCQDSRGPSVERFVVDVARWLPLSWDLFPVRREPLTTLLRHSDCEGVIYVRNQRRLAERLDELADRFPPRFGGHPDWTPEMEPSAIYDGIGEAARRFAAGLRDAYAKRETVTFG